jgi:HNH endonuclease
MKRIEDILEYNPETGVFKWKSGPLVNRPVGTMDRGYLRITVNGIKYKASRLAWYLYYGVWPGEIDHINRQKDDDRIANLRDVSRSENQINTPARTSSGEKGVYYRWNVRKWVVYVRRGYRLRYLGGFPSREEAIRARDKYLTSGNKR